MGVSKRRTPGAAIIGGLLVVIVAALSLCGCEFGRLYVTPQDMDVLQAKLAQEYPGFSLERVYLSGTPRGLIFLESVTVDAQLLYHGQHEFRLLTGRYYGNPGGSDRWTAQINPGFMHDRVVAASFIDAFTRVHPEKGLVVSDPLGPILNRPLTSDPIEVVFTKLSYVESAGGVSKLPLSSWRTDTWRAVKTPQGITWTYLGSR